MRMNLFVRNIFRRVAQIGRNQDVAASLPRQFHRLMRPGARVLTFCSITVILISLFMAGCASKPETLAGANQPSAPSPYSPAGGTNLPGLRPDGSVLLPNQWSLRPAGTQIDLRDFPVNIAVHPDGGFVAVLHSGYS